MAIDDAVYREGLGDRLAGKDATDNPYRNLTDKWFEWADGWKDQDQHLTGRDEALDSIVWFGPPSTRSGR